MPPRLLSIYFESPPMPRIIDADVYYFAHLVIFADNTRWRSASHRMLVFICRNWSAVTEGRMILMSTLYLFS
jgi:hypothetical protein